MIRATARRRRERWRRSTVERRPVIELQAAPGASAVGEPAPAPRPDPARRLALVACGMALGVLIVALAYAGNRDHLRGAAEVYWVGQCVLFGAPAALLLGRRAVSRVEAIGIAVGLPAATYVIKECYSPIQFRFLDELAHVQTAQAILATHHLFHPNTALPVSPQYPGLEIATTALASLSHLSIYAAGTVVVGVAHILLAAGMYLLFLEVTRRPRIACLAVVIYATGPHYAFFDSYFIYEAIALPFMVACLLAVLRARREPRLGIALVWSGVAILCAAATVVSHHVTSWVLLGALICLEATSWRSWRALRSGWPLHATLAVVAAMVGVWDLRISPADVADMATVIGSVTHSLSAHRTKLAVSAPFSPRFDVWMEYLAELTVLVLVGVGGWRLWRTRHRPGSLLRLVAVVGAMGFFAALAIRLRGSNGSQLWGRATTYYLIPVSVMAAVALRRPPPRGSRWETVAVAPPDPSRLVHARPRRARRGAGGGRAGGGGASLLRPAARPLPRRGLGALHRPAQPGAQPVGGRRAAGRIRGRLGREHREHAHVAGAPGRARRGRPPVPQSRLLGGRSLGGAEGSDRLRRRRPAHRPPAPRDGVLLHR